MKLNGSFFLITTISCLLFSCMRSENKLPVVFNFSTQEARDEFNLLQLDSLYTNLLGTERDEAEADTLYHRWLDFNKELAGIVRQNNFEWGAKDSCVILWNRVYCSPEGEIEYYLYLVRDSTVSSERAEAFGEFIQQQLPVMKYNVKRNYKYAQCGSFRHFIY